METLAIVFFAGSFFSCSGLVVLGRKALGSIVNTRFFNKIIEERLLPRFPNYVTSNDEDMFIVLRTIFGEDSLSAARQ